MHTIWIPLVLMILSAGAVPGARRDSAAQTRPPVADISAMAWLQGTWVIEAGATTEEHWTPAAGGAMLGTSRTIARGRMVAFEYLRIVERDGGLVYIAQPGGSPLTEFVLSTITGSEVVFENPAHDYPRMIRYARQGDDGFVATISETGGLRPQEFRFRRQVRSRSDPREWQAETPEAHPAHPSAPGRRLTEESTSFRERQRHGDDHSAFTRRKRPAPRGTDDRGSPG